MQCPRFEKHKNRDAHPSCRLNADKGTFYCDPCGWGGGIVDLAEALGVEVPRPEQSNRRHKQRSKERPVHRLHFESIGPISEPTQREFAERLGKDYPKETWEAFGIMEGKLQPGNSLAIGFPSPAGGWYAVLYRHPDGKTGKPYTFCFTDGAKAFLLTAGLERSDPVLLCEGPWDAMQAYTDGFAVATGTAGAGTCRPEWSARLRGRQVLVVYDVDAVGRAGSKKALASLKSAGVTAQALTLPLSGAEGEKDLSDHRKSHTADDLRKLAAEACLRDEGSAGLVCGSSSVAAAIDQILAGRAPARLKRREAANLVVDDLFSRGELVHALGNRQFYFDKEEKRLYDLDSPEFRSLIMKIYNINPAEPEFRHFMEAVRAAAANRGRLVRAYRFCFYDPLTNRLYISGGRGQMLRLDGQTTTWVNNGTDGVLFEDYSDAQTIPVEVLTTEVKGDPLHDLILGRVNFSRGSAVILSPMQQRLILRIWIIAIFFPELLPAAILLLLYGERGSGKTSTLKAILKFLLGPAANVTPLTKEDGFLAAVSHEFLLALDNVDSHCRWIEDRLATVATGQTIRLRKLYTTNEMVSFPSRCFLALTARTPKFRRDDIVDRLQILRVDRLEKFGRESNWYAEIERLRPELWAQLIRDLNLVVARLGNAPATTPETFRMADWASLASTIGEALGQGERVRAALQAAEVDKAHFLLETDDLYELIHALAHEQSGREWKAGALFTELRARAEQANMDFTVKSPKSLGRILHQLEPALKLMIKFEISKSRHDGQAAYTLGPLPSQAGSPTSQMPVEANGHFRDPDF